MGSHEGRRCRCCKTCEIERLHLSRFEPFLTSVQDDIVTGCPERTGTTVSVDREGKVRPQLQLPLITFPPLLLSANEEPEGSSNTRLF
ncbi:hypothetical protein F2P81_022641 [Scophthalmus maximus]|uniref:Uncharacterized protein n=1 Tax=Scophthalmus maximus TaxID=52904 RepID=A0A6A4S275_SCOMX|nr:hypothetical protein F2P81_022641 [Scophthalmus maximus]